jgi:ATP-dependent Clp protease ATP-binding subunit ClpA
LVENLSELNRRALHLAKRLAARSGASTAGPAHILQAILELPDSRAARLLTAVGKDPEQIRDALRERHAEQSPLPVDAVVKLEPSSLAVMEIASLTARRLEHPTLCTDHVLLALLQLRDAEAEPLLADCTARVEQLEGLSREDRELEKKVEKPPLPQGEVRRLAHRFTPVARDLFAAAHEQAHRFANAFIDIEHLLLALLQLRDEQALEVPGVTWDRIDLEDARTRLSEKLESAHSSSQSEVRLTLRANKVVELAVQEAYLAREDHVGVEHILLGMLGFEKGLAGEVLHTDLAVVREQLMERTPVSVAESKDEVAVGSIDVWRYRFTPDLLQTVPAEVARRHGILPLHERGGVLTVVSGRPPDAEGELARELQHALGGMPVRIVLGGEEDVERLVRKFYAE